METTNFIPVIQRFYGEFVQVTPLFTEIEPLRAGTSGQKLSDVVKCDK